MYAMKVKDENHEKIMIMIMSINVIVVFIKIISEDMRNESETG